MRITHSSLGNYVIIKIIANIDLERMGFEGDIIAAVGFIN